MRGVEKEESRHLPVGRLGGGHSTAGRGCCVSNKRLPLPQMLPLGASKPSPQTICCRELLRTFHSAQPRLEPSAWVYSNERAFQCGCGRSCHLDGTAGGQFRVKRAGLSVRRCFSSYSSAPPSLPPLDL